MKRKQFHKQSGASLMEVLVAMSISLVVTAAMIAMMSNSLSHSARIVNMTKLTDDLRVAMQMMTRDVRRSNFNANSMLCFANDNCGADGSIAAPREVFINRDTNQCFWFVTDRNFDNYTSDVEAGAFRRFQVDPEGDGTTVGVLQMWTGVGEPPANVCEPDYADDEWVQITDPTSMDIVAFEVIDNDGAGGLSYSQVIQTDAAGNPLLEQQVRKIRMSIQGELVLDDSIQRSMVDIITVRNDLLL
jgi:hypothetical protein